MCAAARAGGEVPIEEADDVVAQPAVDLAAEIARPFLTCPVTAVEEIGDGNINFVFRVRAGSESVIVKRAVPYVRVVVDWPLTTERARIEADALRLEHDLAPGLVPRVLGFDRARTAIVVEDLVDHVVLRDVLVDQGPCDHAWPAIAAFAARTLLGTSPLLLDRRSRSVLHQRFGNPELCAITEDLVFTAPFGDAPSNNVDDALLPAAQRLWSDRRVRRAAAHLKFVFMASNEAIIHGDLHTGSVMVSAGDTRIIDPEFASPGPMAFDVGKVLGNLALSHLAHVAQGHDPYARRVTEWAAAFWAGFVEEAARLWPPDEPWRDQFLSQLLETSARFAGAVMCRRTVGLAGVADIRGIDDRVTRLRAEVAALAGGTALLTSRSRSLAELWEHAVGGRNSRQ